MAKIVILVLAYNEERSLNYVISRIPSKILGFSPDIILVNDGSTDHTAKIGRDMGIDVVSHKKNMGLGVTIRTGLSAALKKNPDVIVHLDGDGQYRPEEIPKLVSFLLKNNFDLVLGTRFKNLNYKMPIVKNLGNRLVSFFIRHLTRTRISDTQTGFRAMTPKLAKFMVHNLKGTYTYTQEMVLHAVLNGYKVGEIPLSFDKRMHGESRLILNLFSYLFKVGIIVIKTLIHYLIN